MPSDGAVGCVRAGVEILQPRPPPGHNLQHRSEAKRLRAWQGSGSAVGAAAPALAGTGRLRGVVIQVGCARGTSRSPPFGYPWGPCDSWPPASGRNGVSWGWGLGAAPHSGLRFELGELGAAVRESGRGVPGCCCPPWCCQSAAIFLISSLEKKKRSAGMVGTAG